MEGALRHTARVRICLVYDCLFPWSIGGAERWYRALAERLAAEGHAVTYLTRRQWNDDDRPEIPGVRVICVSHGGELYSADGRRRIGPPLRFGLGVLRHLVRHRRSYDVVHLCSFPYFPLIAAALARPRDGYRLVVDWFEVWSPEYWVSYLGPIGGRVGLAVQRLCLRIPQAAHCFSERHGRRLTEQGLRSIPVLVGGLYDGPTEPSASRESRASVVAAGRQIAEKRFPAVVEAIAELRSRGTAVTGVIFGDGPDHGQVLDRIAACGLVGSVSAPGFVDAAELEEAMGGALCLVHPSSREGYGLVVIEAAARGTPVVVVEGPDNAAAELVVDGVNGFVAPGAGHEALADAIESVLRGGEELRAATRRWFEENASRLSVDGSLATVVASYEEMPSARS